MTPCPSRMRAALRRTAPAAAAALAACAVLAGCTSSPSVDAGTADADTDAAQSASPAPQAPSQHGPGSGDTPDASLPDGISQEAADALCADLDGKLQSLRTYTVTPGKVTLNGAVITWAAQNGVDLVDLAQHRDRVDQALSARCPDVRDGVTSALEVPDVASVLVGL